MYSRRIIDKALTIKGEQNFSAGHIFQSAIRLSPVPFLAKDLGDLRATFIPMLVNSRLNGLKISLSDGSFSDG